MNPQQPVAPNPGMPPQPTPQPVPQPQQPLPPSPAPLPPTPTPPVQQPIPPLPPTQAPVAAQPSMQPQPPLGGVPTGLGQPPVTPVPPTGPTAPPVGGPAFNPQMPSGGSRGRLKTILIAVGGLIASLLIGILVFSFIQSNAYKEEIKVGKDFVQAVQDSKYEQAGKMMDPEVAKICERVVQLTARVNQPMTLDDCFKDMLLNGFAPSVGKGEINKELVTTGKFGDQEYAVVIYKVGSSNVSVLELYKDSGEPYVLMTASGRRDIKDEKEFESSYNSYKNIISTTNAQLDAAEKQIEASPQSATTDLNGLFGDN